jgi:two-component system, OmpR family, phosphate regulon response regulator PhoB
MSDIIIFVTTGLSGGLEPVSSGQYSIRFELWDGTDMVSPPRNAKVYALIDWTVGGVSGLELCRRLRCQLQTANVHIILILEEDVEENRKKARRASANRCVIGPVSRDRLVKLVLEMHLPDEPDEDSAVLRLGDLAMDVPAFQARWQGKPIPLMPNEFALLRFFMENPSRVYTRTQLIKLLGKQDDWIDERTVDAWVGRLRRSLNAAGATSFLRTVRSFGFIMDRP